MGILYGDHIVPYRRYMRWLTYWYRYKMAANSQMAFSDASSWKMYQFRLRFHSILLIPKGSNINIPSPAPIMAWRRHYLNQKWLVYWRIYASFGLNELSFEMAFVCLYVCILNAKALTFPKLKSEYPLRNSSISRVSISRHIPLLSGHTGKCIRKRKGKTPLALCRNSKMEELNVSFSLFWKIVLLSQYETIKYASNNVTLIKIDKKSQILGI